MIAAMMMSGCAVIGGIFKAGMGVGILLVVVIIAVAIYIFMRMGKRNTG